VANDLEFSQVDQKEWQVVHRSQHMEGDDIIFQAKGLSSVKLCDNDFNLPLQIVLMKYKKNGSHYEIAMKETTLGEMAGINRKVKMKNSKKMENKQTPSFEVTNFNKKEIITFMDYLKGGLSLVQFMGIDFTLSNKPCTSTNSLHYMSPGNLNQYQRAILCLGEVLEKYNTSKTIPCYGFGAVLPNDQKSFNFPINLNFENPYLANYGQVYQCYQNILNQIRFSGPTNFAPLLKDIITYTESNMSLNQFSYTVFTILTDGAISDIENTILEIVRASRLPISIIIIGRIYNSSNFFRSGQRRFFQNGHSRFRQSSSQRY
jgi:hypothetical protein